MNDISKCSGDNCLAKDSCFRFTCPVATPWQTWFVAPPLKVEADACPFYMDNTKETA